MANKMLIDATHPEETRVVVLRGNRVEEFDFESANRRQLRGNIYLAKVTRVEPSLQAAFVDYGGNRHGFLAFSEIHPDYYQIPVADRQALIDEEERAHRAAEDEVERRAGGGRRPRHRGSRRRDEAVRSGPVDAEGGQEASPDATDQPVAENQTGADPFQIDEDRAQIAETASATADIPPEDAGDRVDAMSAGIAGESVEPAPARPRADDITAIDISGEHMPAGDVEAMTGAGFAPQPMIDSDRDTGETMRDDAQADREDREEVDRDGGDDDEETGRTVETDRDNGDSDSDDDDAEDGEEEEVIESVGGADALEELPDRAYRSRRQYKIQEVIKRRQIMLVQVVKEERGTKGAALTTYLSLAGRYSVLMPNTARGGGISRKITNVQDRKKLKEIAQELEVPEGMGVILRTAGAARTKTEVKRDFEYLLRVWETVRDLTLKSSAPTLVYEEGSLVKRSIRDLYNKDIDEVMVAGENAYHEAKDFMRMLMPSHAKNVRLYQDSQPLLARFGVEHQLDAMFSPVVQLRSGGYIVINQTEALVAIDVNSGRATREHHIEDTAHKTNGEAAEEIARQLRLRDLAGLIVIDFIDMDENRNNRSVERRLKECLKNDRARIQVGRISHFGLMEMSRQRIRTSVLESSTDKCPHCGGSGHIRSVSSVSLQLLRMLEDLLLRGATHNLVIRTQTDIALYVLNHKRAHLRDFEERFKITITVNADASLGAQQPFVIEKGELVHSVEQARAIALQPANIVALEIEDEPEIEEIDEDAEIGVEGDSDGDSEGEEAAAEDTGDGERAESSDGRRRRRRRRRGRRGEGADQPVRETAAEHAVAHEDHNGDDEEDEDEDGGAERSDQPERAGQPERPVDANGEEDGNGERRRRRRGRRGGRRNRRSEGEIQAPEAPFAPIDEDIAHAVADFGGPPIGEDIERQEPLRVEAARPHWNGEPLAEAGRPQWDDEQPAYAAPPRSFERSDEPVAEPVVREPEAEPAPPPAAEPPGPLFSVEPEQPSLPPAQSIAPPVAESAPAPVAAPQPPKRRSTVREPAPVILDTGEPVYVPPPPPPVIPVVISADDQPDRPSRSGWWKKK